MRNEKFIEDIDEIMDRLKELQCRAESDKKFVLEECTAIENIDMTRASKNYYEFEIRIGYYK